MPCRLNSQASLTHHLSTPNPFPQPRPAPLRRQLPERIPRIEGMSSLATKASLGVYLSISLLSFPSSRPRPNLAAMAKKGIDIPFFPFLGSQSINTLANPIVSIFLSKKTGKSRIVSVRLLSMAMTGFIYHFTRPRTAPPLSMLKYDPIGT